MPVKISMYRLEIKDDTGMVKESFDNLTFNQLTDILTDAMPTYYEIYKVTWLSVAHRRPAVKE